MCEKIVSRVEVMGDYDGILYTECECGKKINVHTQVEFDEGKQMEEFSPLYQFRDGKLVGYSRYNASGLTTDDDIKLGENLLWGSRGIDGDEPLMFKPIKHLTIPHVKAIITGSNTKRKDYLEALTTRLTSIITITKK